MTLLVAMQRSDQLRMKAKDQYAIHQIEGEANSTAKGSSGT